MPTFGFGHTSANCGAASAYFGANSGVLRLFEEMLIIYMMSGMHKNCKLVTHRSPIVRPLKRSLFAEKPPNSAPNLMRIFYADVLKTAYFNTLSIA